MTAIVIVVLASVAIARSTSGQLRLVLIVGLVVGAAVAQLHSHQPTPTQPPAADER